MSLNASIEAALAAARAGGGNGGPLAPMRDAAALAKAFTQPATATTGLQNYDLEAPAKMLYPVLTPLRNAIPRVSGKGGIQANWKAITGINVTGISAGLGEGNRGGIISQTVKDYFAAYRGLGLDNYVTFEADYSAEGFQDVKALAVQQLLKALMIQEEATILGGTGTTGLGQTPTPNLTAIAGGAIPTGTTVSVGCVALTMEGLYNVQTNLSMSSAVVVPGIITRPNADGSTDTFGGGAGAPSAVASIATSGNSNTVTADVAPVMNAFGYAWFAGVAPNLYFQRVTTINSVVLTTLVNGGQLFSTMSGDNSVNQLKFNGLSAIAAAPGSNSYYAAQPTGPDGYGTPLTADGTGGIVEVDAALASFWNNWKLSPDEMWVSSQEQNFFRRKVLTAPSGVTPLARFTIQTGQGDIKGGSSVRGYLNPFGMGQASEIPIKLHPNLPPGNIMFLTHSLPYALNDVTNVMQVKTRKEYYQIEWPLRSRKYEYGVYCDEVLQHYFPPSIGWITNIGAG